MAERIVSLLPSATEVLWFLGLGDRVVGVTYECGEPPEAARVPHVTDTIIPAGSDPAAIDRIIAGAVAAGRELYRLDRDLLASLDPDLIVSQDLCRVCALPSGSVEEAVASLGCRATVFGYDPLTLDGVLDTMDRLAVAAGAGDDAHQRVARLRERLDHHRSEANAVGRPDGRPGVLLLEWTDPPYVAGHWIPDQIEAAGGTAVLGRPGRRSGAVTWDEVAATGAEVLLVAPCGFDLDGASEQLRAVVARPELADLPAVRSGRVHALDADAHVVRPGPRLVDGVAAMARLIRPTDRTG